MHLIAIGGSDAGVSAALRAREVDPGLDVTVISSQPVVNFSGSGIPFHLSGEVPDAESLAHRSTADLLAAQVAVKLETTVTSIDSEARKINVMDGRGKDSALSYDELVIATGALPEVPRIGGLYGPDAVRAVDGVHALRSFADTMAVAHTIARFDPQTAVVIGADYVGMEIAEAMALRGMAVTHFERLAELMPAVDPEIGALARGQLEERGIEVLTGTAVKQLERTEGGHGRFRIEAARADGRTVVRNADIVLLAAGVRPASALAATIGAELGERGAIVVDGGMRTRVPHVFAAGDCAMTLHRMLGPVYLPFGTTAHKQGRVAGENAAGGEREFPGSLGTQVVKVFDHAVARTGVLDVEAARAGFDPLTIGIEAEDRAPYYPGARPLTVRITGDRGTRRLLGVQMFGHVRSEIASRVDVASTAIFNAMTVDQVSDLDLSYTPPLGRAWDPLATAAQAWLAASN